MAFLLWSLRVFWWSVSLHATKMIINDPCVLCEGCWDSHLDSKLSTSFFPFVVVVSIFLIMTTVMTEIQADASMHYVKPKPDVLLVEAPEELLDWPFTIPRTPAGTGCVMGSEPGCKGSIWCGRTEGWKETWLLTAGNLPSPVSAVEGPKNADYQKFV